ncbi:MAG TPA: hypothetical protein EYQ41_09595 [Micavibrio sp.]|nr:hypothetical protein [Micavibrio sp.]
MTGAPLCLGLTGQMHSTLLLDADMMEGPIVNYHPMENHMTVGLTPAELLRFFDSIDREAHIVDLKPAAPDA